MEAVEEPPLINAAVDGVKVTVVVDENDENAVASVASDVCHKSNGVADSETAEVAAVESNTAPSEDGKCEIEQSVDVKHEAQENDKITAASDVSELDSSTAEVVVSDAPTNKEATNDPSPDIAEAVKEQIEDKDTVNVDNNTGTAEIQLEELAEVVKSDPSIERVTFQTEILVETNDSEIIETITEEVIEDQDSNNLLSELGHGIELSEALRSSNVTDSAENNNCAVRQEVFNKEELLDILEGNDEGQPGDLLPPNFKNRRSDKMLETQIALQQLSRLKGKKTKRRHFDRQPRAQKMVRTDKIQKVVTQEPVDDEKVSTEKKNEESIVNVLVKEWDDEEAPEVEKSKKLLEESEQLLHSTEEVVKTQDTVCKEEEASVRTSIDSSSEAKTPALNKSSDEGQPQRRLGRVIKKKVIFDPDNPDTFTKSKSVLKSKEPSMEKDQTPSKIQKIKTEQAFQRSKSKSPTAKLQWKKPSPKNCKQNKRLTEVDKLLMDEGAVNMIYQLTPEATKGKKNMKTKAEFIKKLQSSTPDSKEMKFRERKKESKYEDGEAKKILGGKQRPSLSSSVKSPSVCEDFEAHSADDSIIYRRHSSSSYSSSCMSPHRLSDVEASNQGSSRNSSQSAQVDNSMQASIEGNSNRSTADVFMSDTDPIRTDIINKDDCLSIKQKLNSKLNLALNKRKRENSKPEKPLKIKKVMKIDENNSVNTEDFKYLSINFDQRLAEISVQKPGTKCNVELIRELEKALQLIEQKKDISVTLLPSECGTTYSELDLRPLLDANMEKSTNFAYELAESIKSLLQAVEQHTKLICSGVSGRCSGIGLALIGLSDVALASERASFSISPKSHGAAAPIQPGLSVFTSHGPLSQPLLNDLIVFGRRLTAAEALRGGLVSRVLWPENFNEQIHTIAKDIAAQPAQNIWLKKQLLNMKKGGAESTFLAYLEKERDLLVEYWTSVEGQEIIRAAYTA
ncbi:uncharacterized protein LOC124634882 [Helicoverpa zea]|uniref:uncharacterized protein LOC124634882 n=1 Tax=Helicoverpa zea TaxID=7113 RepID=UPI001F56A247|nr:uncharacterized protein LOC124634882 [Helicoverpa zea]